MTDQALAAAGARRLSPSTRLFYGTGAVAFGVKDNGFSYFLQFFYAQVVGLPAATVGLAIMAALVIDAFFDPIIGQWSDNTRSTWGRRHPFMYAAALPVAASYLLLWNPPIGWEQGAQIAYLIAVSVLIRTFISCYEIPSAALAAELTTDYDERTRLLSYRYLFGWAGGLAMYVLALTVFLKGTPENPVGQLNAEGYANFGLFGAIVMFVAIVAAAIGTHREIPNLREAPHDKLTMGQFWRELLGTLANRTFLMVLASAFFLAMALGLYFSINLYFSTYFWEFSAAQIGGFGLSSFAAAVIAFAATPYLSKRLGKRPAAFVAIPIAMVFTIAPVVLRLIGLMPPNGDPALYPLVFGVNILGTGAGVIGTILQTSMIADVVEDTELRTGRRQEGVFFAAYAFVAKATAGMGIFASGMIVGAIGFPQGAEPGSVPSEVLRNLGLVYSPAIVVLYGVSALFLLGYGITRESHAETLRKLAAP